MDNKEFNKKFVAAYRKIATTGKYSIQLANKIGYGAGVLATDMPKVIAEKLEAFGGGCCFHYSFALINELEKEGITAFWACVPEPEKGNLKVQKAVVVYLMPDGKRYVADIIEDVKASVKLEDFDGDSCKWCDSDGLNHDHSRISLADAAKASDSELVPGYLRVFGKPYEGISFSDFLGLGKYEEITA